MNAKARLFAATIVFLLAPAYSLAAAVPTITSISPPSVYVNGPAFTLTVNGTGFVAGDSVYLTYGYPLATTLVSSSQLTAQVPASYLTYATNYQVYVDNSLNQESNSENLSVVDLSPTLQAIAPTSVVAHSAPGPLTLTGSNFMNGAAVQWNGKSVPTTYISSSQLQITPSKSELAIAGIVSITVTNPPPGSISDSQNFNVTYPASVTTLDLPANNLVWDPYAQRIYASVPSSYGVNGNTIAVINPANGKITGYYFAGSEPNQLALSADAKYLYVGLNGNGSVQRLILPNFTPDVDVSLGTQNGSLNTAAQIGVSPSDDHTWSVALGANECCGSGYGVYFYKDAAQLPDALTTYPYPDNFVWVNSTTMYGYSSGTIDLVTVNSSSGTVAQQWSGDTNGTTIDYAAGLIYGDDGKVFNPAAGLLVGSYDLGGCCSSYSPVLPDPSINRFFALSQTPFFSGFGITAFNLADFTPIAVTNLSQLSESSSTSFVSWGNNGAAFIILPPCCNTGAAQLEIVKSPLMFLTFSTTNNPVPTSKTLSPASAAHGGWNFPVTITGTGFVPGSTVTWNGTSLYAADVSSTQLTLYVPYSEIASAGTASVVVSNPAPGGGKATALTFTIN